MVSKKKIRNTKLIAIITLIIASTAGWAVYALINQGAEDMLVMFGITNVYAQLGIVVLAALAILFLLGFGISKSIDKVLGS